jgi:hypothetical protein
MTIRPAGTARAQEHEAMSQRPEQQKSAEQTRRPFSRLPRWSPQAEARRAPRACARRQLAQTSRVQQEIAGGYRPANGFARFERMHHQIELAEAEAEALGSSGRER